MIAVTGDKMVREQERWLQYIYYLITLNRNNVGQQEQPIQSDKSIAYQAAKKGNEIKQVKTLGSIFGKFHFCLEVGETLHKAPKIIAQPYILLYAHPLLQWI